jgi:hypothetical protein
VDIFHPVVMVDISLVISAERGVLTKPSGNVSRLGWLEPDHFHMFDGLYHP